MALYITIIGLGIFIGILLNFHSNSKSSEYSKIGLVVILVAGAIAFFVILNPFFFKNYSELIFFLVFTAVSLFVIYTTALFIAYMSVNKRQAENSILKNNYSPETDMVNEDLEDFIQTKSIDTEDIRIASQPSQSEKPRLYVQNKANMKRPIENAPGYTETKDEKVILPADSEKELISVLVNEEPKQAEKLLTTLQDEIKTEQPYEAEQQHCTEQGTEEALSYEQNKPEEDSRKTSAEPNQADNLKLQQMEQGHKANKSYEKYASIIDKASELISTTKYLYAIELLQACLKGTEDKNLQKQADIMLLECLVLSNQYSSAQKRWFEILNKKYDMDFTDKAKLKEIMTKLKTINV